MSANDRQVGGDHYRKVPGEQHWDRVYRLFGPGYFVGCATKYVERYKLKEGKKDLEKAIHFIEKLIELEYPAQETDVPRHIHSRPLAMEHPFGPVGRDAFMAATAEFSEDPVVSADRHGNPDFKRTHEDEIWQCEGYYGDMTQLYRHKKDRRLFRAPSLSAVYEIAGVPLPSAKD